MKRLLPLISALKEKGINVVFVPSSKLLDFAAMNWKTAEKFGMKNFPKNTIWIDEKYKKPGISLEKTIYNNIKHELVEASKIDKGSEYWPAHQEALKAEKKNVVLSREDNIMKKDLQDRIHEILKSENIEELKEEVQDRKPHLKTDLQRKILHNVETLSKRIEKEMEDEEEKDLVPVKPIKREKAAEAPMEKDPRDLPDDWYKNPVPRRWTSKSEEIHKAYAEKLLETFIGEYKASILLKGEYKNQELLHDLADQINKFYGFGISTHPEMDQEFLPVSFMAKGQTGEIVDYDDEGEPYVMVDTVKSVVSPSQVAQFLYDYKLATCQCTGCGKPSCIKAMNKSLSSDIRKGLPLETGSRFWKMYENALKTGPENMSDEDLVVLREFLYARV